MSDIATLKEMIQETATVPLEDSYGKKKVTLKEPDGNYSVTINGMPDIDNSLVNVKISVSGLISDFPKNDIYVL
jgi:hypothetical protein